MTQANIKNREHLISLIKDFDTAMFITRASNGTMHGRPMAIAEVNDSGSVYFPTSVESRKVEEINRDPNMTLLFQGKTKWVSLSGKSQVTQDKALIQRLWKEDWKIWFPKGKDDPELCILDFKPSQGEYWDNSGLKGISFIYEAIKAYASGTTPEESTDQNAKVLL